MNTIAIIPARGGSKRLPGKNIMQLGNLPLLAHSILYAKQNSFIDEVYVSTDNNEIKDVALKYGAIVIERPLALSGDFEPTVTALKHVLESIEDNVDNVILLQPTNPLRPKDMLEKAFEIFVEKNHDSLFTVSIDEHKFGKINNGKFIPFNYKIGQRSQDLEPLYYENGLLYIAKATLIKKDEIISELGYPLIINHEYAKVDIDTQKDFDYAKYLLQHKTLKK